MNVENKKKWMVDISQEDIANANTLSEVFDNTQSVLDRCFREASVKCKRCVTCKHIRIVAYQNQVLHDLMTLGRSYNRTFEIICKANQPCFMDSETECSAYSENQKATALYGNPFLKCKCGSTDTYTTAECYKDAAK